MRSPAWVALIALLCGCAGGSSGEGSVDKRQLPVVTGLTLTSASDALRVDASWQSAGPRFSYAVARTDGVVRTLASVSGTSYSVTGLVPGESICIAVAAVAERMTGPMSAAVCATALDTPRPPASVRAEGIASGLLIDWTALPDGPPIEGWDVVVSGNESSLPATLHSMTATGLTDGTRYEIAVYARNAGGRSRPATISAVAGPRRVPAPPGWIVGDRVPILLARTAVVAHESLWVIGFELHANVLTPATAVATIDAQGVPRNWEILAQKPPYTSVYASSAASGAARLLAIGGSCCGLGAAGSGEVRISALRADGSTDAWAIAGDPYAPRASAPGVVADQMHLYVIGGFWWSGGSFSGYGTNLVHVHVADLTREGNIARWRSGAPLPRAGRALATSLNGRIYAVIGASDGGLPPYLVYAEPSAGSIASWRDPSAPGGFASVKALTAAAGRLYVVDGDGKVFVGAVTPDGDVSSWSHWPAEALGETLDVLVGSGSLLYALRFDTVLVGTIDDRTGHTVGEAPEVPAQLPTVRAWSPAGGVVRVSWDPVPDAPAYEVKKGEDAPVRVTTTETTFTDLDPYSRIGFSVRAVNDSGPGQWARSDPVYPWPSSTWRPGIEMGPSREYAFFAGNSIFAVTSPTSFTAPLDDSGMPWTTIGRDRYAGGVLPPHHDNEGAAVLPVSETTACLVLTGGRQYRDLPGTPAVSTSCIRDDGFEGQWLATPSPAAMPAVRFDHASVAVGNRIYVLGGSQDAVGVDVPLSDVSFATFGADLSVSGWRSTTPLPGPSATIAATAAEGRVYAIAPSFASDRLFCADVNGDGSLSPWREAGRMPYTRARPSAIVVHGFFYVLGGSADGEPTVLIGRLDSRTGAVTSWSADPADSFARPLMNPAVLSRGNRLYVFGSSGGIGQSPLQTAEIDPATGRPKPWR